MWGRARPPVQAEERSTGSAFKVFVYTLRAASHILKMRGITRQNATLR
jgi:hypothetical protein